MVLLAPVADCKLSSDTVDLEDLLKLMARDLDVEPKLHKVDKDAAARLRAAQDRLNVAHEFRIGDLVQWKQGLKNRKRPAYGEPAIVTRVLHPFVTDPTQEVGDRSYGEQLTVVLGLLNDARGELDEYHFDGRRFEPVPTVA